VLAVSIPGVLANDTDDEADPLHAELRTTAGHGTLVMAANGSFTYAPDAGFTGTDSFTYRASDGRMASAAATVRITVESHDVAPDAAADAYATQQDQALVVPDPGVLGNDTDADGDALSALLVDRPGHGTMTLAPNGSFRYVPAAGFAGTDRFTYEARDGTLASATVIVTLRVTALPTCAGRVATVVGSAGTDVLRGTPRPDVIVGLGGDDVVTARGGDDVVCAGGGNDRVSGGPGNDLLLGGPGRDRLDGGPGDDRLVQGN
jgi:VCBS repeat-containing protein